MPWWFSPQVPQLGPESSRWRRSGGVLTGLCTGRRV